MFICFVSYLFRGELTIFEEEKCEVGYIKFIKNNPARGNIWFRKSEENEIQKINEVLMPNLLRKKF